jgi:ABC-type Fe3+ transport system substrate-binding protein
LFDKSFYAKFVKTGILTGYIDETQREHIPATVSDVLYRHNIGSLAFSSWGVAQDYSVTEIRKNPGSWAEILEPDYLNQITVHGCHGKAGSLALLLFLQQQCGDEAIARFARNVIDIRHFSLIIKRMDSLDKKRTALNVLPDVAASHIPSWKSVERLYFAEGCPLNPMVLMVKKSKLDNCMPIINFFHSNSFQQMLHKNGYLMPNDIRWSHNYILPDFERMANEGFTQITANIEKIYQGHLRHEDIDNRLINA